MCCVYVFAFLFFLLSTWFAGYFIFTKWNFQYFSAVVFVEFIVAVISWTVFLVYWRQTKHKTKTYRKKKQYERILWNVGGKEARFFRCCCCCFSGCCGLYENHHQKFVNEKTKTFLFSLSIPYDYHFFLVEYRFNSQT